ncbi:unnamed protein product [Ectocarpus sp. CCAP 1310/34]|nr:unnamed protein product [Ectocarpus sp. CCAP 1310/34]
MVYIWFCSMAYRMAQGQAVMRRKATGGTGRQRIPPAESPSLSSCLLMLR